MLILLVWAYIVRSGSHHQKKEKIKLSRSYYILKAIKEIILIYVDIPKNSMIYMANAPK